MNTNETDVYLLRKTSISRDELGRLKPDQYKALLKEVYFQESVDEYRKAHSIASLMAAIYNTIPQKRGAKTFKASDFLRGDMPERNPQKDSLEDLANKHDIKLPGKEIKDRG